MKKWITTILLIIILYVLQTTLFSALSIAGSVPNLLIILLVVVGYRYGQVSGLICGFLTGLFVDLLDGNYIGLYALLYMLIGYVIGFVNKIYLKDDFTFPIILTVVSDFLCNIGIFVIGFLLRNRTHLWFYMRTIIFPEVIYTAVISVFLYRPFQKLYILLEPKEKEVTNND